MVSRAWMLAASLTVVGGPAMALCMDGPPTSCTVNGKQGTRQCLNGHITPCITTGDSGGGSGTATLLPRYFVLTVVYAPPGTHGGMSTSNVTYGSGSTTGTTTAASKSFKQSYGVTAKTGAGLIGNGSEVSVSFTYNRSSEDDSSLTITKATTATIQDTGPATDGIDHDHDLIYLWLNPTIDVTVDNTSAAWSIQGGTSDVQYVYAGWLKNPSQMPPGVAQVLQHYGLTTQDYADILKQDSFANGSGALTPRYQQLYTTFPYEPPYAQGDPVPTLNFTATNTTANMTGTVTENDYKVGLTAKTSLSFLVNASLETDDSWEWDNKSTNSKTTTTTQSAAVTVGGPSFGYTGPTDIAVYYDTIYKTFLFRPVDVTQRTGLSGTLTARDGKPAAFQEVTVTSHGTTYRTFTNGRGQYRVFGTLAGPATVRAGGVTHDVATVDAGKPVDLRM